MKKLFLLAMLAVFQLSALKAQEPMFIGTKQSDDGIKRELYKVGAATKTKYVFENGDYFWLKDTDDFDYLQRKGQLASEKHSWRFTYSNAVVEYKGENDEWHMTFHNGDFFITKRCFPGSYEPPLVYLTTEGRDLEWDESRGVFVYEKGKRMTEPRSRVYGSIVDAKVKVGDGKYEHYTDKELNEIESSIAREGDTYGFTYDYDEERNCFVTYQQTFVENYEEKYIDEELLQKSIEERQAMYGVNFFLERRKYQEEIVPLNKQKEYVIAMVEAGKGGMFGLEGISYKDFTKKVKKGELDLDAVVMRYEHEIDSIEKSWIGTRIEQKLHKFYVDYNDTIVSYSFGKIGEESSTTLHYKNGDSLVLINNNIVSGTLTKDNGILVINSKDDIVFKFDNGDKFIPEGLDLHIKEINKSRNFILHKGLLAKADGTVEEVKDGYTESQRLAMQQAEEERQRAEDAAFRKELVAKYGEKMANAYLEGELMVGMPKELLDKFMYRYDYRYLGKTNWSSDTIRYRYARSLIFSVEEVYLYVRNGTLVDFTIYDD